MLADHSVVVDRGRIAAVLPTGEVALSFAPAERLSLPEHALIPGLVNLHTHAAMSLMRGLADDRPLMTWLKEHIWPAETRYVSPEFVYDGTLLASAEMLRGGVTCANDMYFFPESAARAFVDAGMRASVGLIAIEFPSAYASDAEDYLRRGLELRDRVGGEPLLSFCMAPHAPYTVGDGTFRRIATLAEELDLPVHIHLHETAGEVEESLAQHGRRPLARLETLGLLTERLIAVHAVHLAGSEIAALARAGSSVAHCPSSNLKLASGFARVGELLAHGVNVGIGTDGAASNNRLDMFQEIEPPRCSRRASPATPRPSRPTKPCGSQRSAVRAPSAWTRGSGRSPRASGPTSSRSRSDRPKRSPVSTRSPISSMLADGSTSPTCGSPERRSWRADS